MQVKTLRVKVHVTCGQHDKMDNCYTGVFSCVLNKGPALSQEYSVVWKIKDWPCDRSIQVCEK